MRYTNGFIKVPNHRKSRQIIAKPFWSEAKSVRRPYRVQKETLWTSDKIQVLLSSPRPTDKELADRWGCAQSTVQNKRLELQREQREARKRKAKSLAARFLKYRATHPATED
jgi:hypothetical protein